MNKRVIKQLSDMAIDEVSLVDRGANQHALIAIAKNYSVDDLFGKARGSSDEVELDEFHGNDPADVVDDDVANDGHGDTGAPAGKTISGTQKVSGEDITGKAGKAKGKKTLDRAPGRGGEDVPPAAIERHSKGNPLKDALGDSFASNVEKADGEFELAKRLGLLLDDEDFEKAFGPPQQPNFQQGGQSPQMGNPPIAQSVGAQPVGMGQPQQPPLGGQAMPGQPAGPNPMNPGMPSGGPQVPGPTAQAPLPGQSPMGLANMMGQVGTPPQLNIAQLPPEVVQYIQQLEKQLAQSQGQNSDSGADSTDSSDNGSSASNSDSSDSSNKPFGKSGAFTMNEDAFYEELSKAIRDEDGRAEFSKALQTRFDAYEAEISKAQELAAEERDLRLEREFIAKAAEFDVPVAPDELGPVLKRAAESLSIEDFSVIVKCLDAATELAADVFGEVGKRGMADNAGNVLGAVQYEAEELRKNFELSAEQANAAVFEANPHAYDEYRRGLPGFRG